jgi:hypothetical protein
MYSQAWPIRWLGLILSLPAVANDVTDSLASDRIQAIFENEPLAEAVSILGMLSGTTIEIEGDTSDQRVSAVIRGSTLEESLNSVLSGLSYVVIRRTDGGITVLALGPAGQQAKLFDDHQRTPGTSDPVPLGMSPGQPEVVPPTVQGTPGFTASDIEFYRSLSQQTDPQALDVVPPAEAGSQGMTQAEFDVFITERPELSPTEIEVLPPTKPGGNGLTLAELELLLDRVRVERPLADEVPPD